MMTKYQLSDRALRCASRVAILLGVIALAANSAQATMVIGDAVKLSTLDRTTESLIVGDKKFDQFAYDFTGDMPPPEGVNVIPIRDDLGNLGLRFQGAFMDYVGTVGGSDALITYRVMVLDPEKSISDAHIQGNPSVGDLAGSIIVDETFLPLGGQGEYSMKIWDEGVGTPQLIDWIYFNEAEPIKVLNVQKDILAFAAEMSVTISFIDQTFSQTPEPGTMILLATAGVTICLTRRWRRRSHS